MVPKAEEKKNGHDEEDTKIENESRECSMMKTS